MNIFSVFPMIRPKLLPIMEASFVTKWSHLKEVLPQSLITKHLSTLLEVENKVKLRMFPSKNDKMDSKGYLKKKISSRKI